MIFNKDFKSKVAEFFTNLFERPSSSGFFVEEINVNSGKEDAHKVPQNVPKLYFDKFHLKNFKGIREVDVRFVKNDLVLLLGLNESGKTTILKGIEAFDFRNDPDPSTNPKYFTSIRRKSDVDFDGEAILKADVILESKLPSSFLDYTYQNVEAAEFELLGQFVKEVNKSRKITIARVFNFSNGEPTSFYYRIENEHEFSNTKLSLKVATEIIKLCPPIIYFEDFKDRIPEKIFINPASDGYDSVWFDIIDGLFYNAKPTYTINKFKAYYDDDGERDDDAKTVLRQVNMELNKVFTNRWKSLSGVKQIKDTELEYNKEGEFFELKIYDNDGTNFSIEERSKGALWYLSFLMKTEFRSKKLRMNSGKPVYLIDEPASNLHSTAQTNMIKNFMKLVKDTSIIYTTHSQYLISLKSIKNTYVIKRDNRGTVKATRWGDFIKTDIPEEKYYQPLANLLNILPNNFDIPWKDAIITEGPSDMHVLKVMYEVIYSNKPDFAIYPGTSATKLDSLISLNIGWNANFLVLLDSDATGIESGENYNKTFNLTNEITYLPGENTKIENCFKSEEKKKLYKIAFDKEVNGRLRKKEFSSTFALLNEKENVITKTKKVLSPETKKIFTDIFEKLKKDGD